MSKTTPGELQELLVYVSSIPVLFKTFGFKVTTKNGSADNFSISCIGEEDSEFQDGEGKSASMLPWEAVFGMSHKLCLLLARKQKMTQKEQELLWIY
jgi:hypothetical protein